MKISNLFSLLHTLLSRDQICSLWLSSKPGVEVDPLVQVPGRQEVKKTGISWSCTSGWQTRGKKDRDILVRPHLHVASLLLPLLVCEVAQPLTGHPQQIHLNVL